MICHRKHYLYAYRHDPIEKGPMDHPFGAWLLCGLGRLPATVYCLVALGVLTAAEDGGVLRWSWPWRPAPMRKAALELLAREEEPWRFLP